MSTHKRRHFEATLHSLAELRSLRETGQFLPTHRHTWEDAGTGWKMCRYCHARQPVPRWEHANPSIFADHKQRRNPNPDHAEF